MSEYPRTYAGAALAEIGERMTRQLKSAKGSPDGWKYMPDQPRVCAGCGEPVRFSKDSIWFKQSEPPETWHMSCRPKEAT